MKREESGAERRWWGDDVGSLRVQSFLQPLLQPLPPECNSPRRNVPQKLVWGFFLLIVFFCVCVCVCVLSDLVGLWIPANIPHLSEHRVLNTSVTEIRIQTASPLVCVCVCVYVCVYVCVSEKMKARVSSSSFFFVFTPVTAAVKDSAAVMSRHSKTTQRPKLKKKTS